MTADLKVSIQFLAELEELRAAVPQIKGLFKELLGISKEVGDQTTKAAKSAGSALVDQFGNPLKKVATEVKNLAQEEQKAATATRDLAAQADKAAGAASKAGKALRGMGDDAKAGSGAAGLGLQEVAGHAGTAGASLGSLVKQLGLAYAGLLLFRQGLAFVREGIGFGSQMETAQLGIGSLIAAQGKLTDSTGRELHGREALNAAMVLSQDQMQKLKVAGLETVATTEQLVGAFQQAVGVGLSVGMTLDQVREITIKVTQAAAALGLPMNQLSEEVRSMLQGNIDPRNTRIATALQITNKEVKEWKAAGGSTLADELNKRMEAFGLAGELAAQTWQGVTSNVVEATQTLAGEMTKPLFAQLKDGLQGILSQVFDLKNARISDAFAGLVELGQSGFGALGDLARGALDQIVVGLKGASAWIAENKTAVSGYIAVLSTLTQVLGTGLAGALSVVAGLFGGMVSLLGRYPALILGVVGALTGLVVANGFAATSFATLTASASAAAAAVTAFFTSLGPVGWAVVAIGALAGAALGLRSARKAEQDEAQASAQRLRQEEQTARILVERYEALSRELAKGTLTMAGRIKAEKEMEEVRRELIKLGGAYAQIVQDENGNRLTAIQRLKEENAERERSNNARRVEMALMANLILADIQRQKTRLAYLDQNRMPDTGVSMSAYQKAEAAQSGWYAREQSHLQDLQAEYARTKAIIEGLGPSTSAHELTISQIKERKAELVKLIEETTKAQDKALSGKGDDAATKAYNARKEALVGMRAELAELRQAVPDVITLKGHSTTPAEAKNLVTSMESAARLAKLEAEAMSRVTLEEEKQAKLAALKANLLERTAKLQDEKKSGKFNRKDGEADFQAEKAALSAENAAKIKQIEAEYVKKRELLEADLQARLTAQEEGGLDKRLEAVRRQFKAIREENEKSRIGSKPFLTADQILSAEQAALARERVAQVAADLAKIKHEMSTKAQTLGRGLTDQEKDEVLAPHLAAGGTKEVAANQQMKEDRRGEGALSGIDSGITGWLVQSKNAFLVWKDFAGSVLGGTEGAFGSFFTSLTQRGQDFGQKTKALWTGISGTVVQALAKIGAQHLIAWGIEKAKLAWDIMKSAWETKDTTKTITENTVKQASNTSTASTGFFASFAGTGPWGFALAAAAIVAMFALLGSLTGRKVGGLVGEHGPEFTMLGEEGLEVVAPEHDFKDWARGLVGMGANLQANIGAQQGDVRRYQQQGTEYAQKAVEAHQGSAGTGLAAKFLYADLRGAVIAGESNESRALIGRMIRNCQDDENRRIN